LYDIWPIGHASGRLVCCTFTDSVLAWPKSSVHSEKIYAPNKRWLEFLEMNFKNGMGYDAADDLTRRVFFDAVERKSQAFVVVPNRNKTSL
jgi:hypothetical protein